MILDILDYTKLYFNKTATSPLERKKNYTKFKRRPHTAIQTTITKLTTIF